MLVCSKELEEDDDDDDEDDDEEDSDEERVAFSFSWRVCCSELNIFEVMMPLFEDDDHIEEVGKFCWVFIEWVSSTTEATDWRNIDEDCGEIRPLNEGKKIKISNSTKFPTRG